MVYQLQYAAAIASGVLDCTTPSPCDVAVLQGTDNATLGLLDSNPMRQAKKYAKRAQALAGLLGPRLSDDGAELQPVGCLH